MSESPPPQKGSVRSIISIFENQTFSTTNEPFHLIRRTKSLSNLSLKPVKQPIEKSTISFYQPIKQTSFDLDQVAQQIRHLQSNLETYQTYSRENHIYFQNQIIFILTDLANLNVDVEYKSELTETVKKLNKNLNSRLPDSPVVKIPRVEPKKIPEQRVKTEVKVPVVKSKQVKKEVIQQIVEISKVEEEDEPPVSVKSLKQLFEKNTTESESQREFGATKILRKFPTFNSSADFKYVPYAEKYKTEETLKKQVSFNDETLENFDGTVTYREVIVGSEEELTPNSLSNEESDDTSDADSEDQEEVEGEDF